MENNYYPFVNTPLPYSYHALEPYIDEKTMQLHHDRHLQAYIDHLNAALEGCPRLQALSLEQLIRTSGRLSRDLQAEIRNNAGGVYNHRFFFEGLTNPTQGAPEGMLAQGINRFFCSYEGFLSQFKEAALSVFGSGYAWLVCDRCCLKIMTTANQDSPVEWGCRPILCIDVWEHAYYLKHYNIRADYIDDWMQVINWDRAEERYRRCMRPHTILR